MAKILSDGTLKSQFSVGKGSTLVKIKNNAGVFEVLDTSDGFVYTRVKSTNDNASPNLNDAVTFLDLQAKLVLISFDFDGASVPSPAANTGLFGFCHTAGGIYTAGQVVFDTGTAIVVLKHTIFIMSTTEVVGSVGLNANGVYAKQSGTWTTKGDGSGAGEPTGTVKQVVIPFVYTDTFVSSSTNIPSGCYILTVKVTKSVAWNGTAPTVLVAIQGSTPLTVLATADSDLTSTIEDVSLDTFKVGGTNAGNVRVTLGGSGASAGAGEVIVLFTNTQNV